MSYTINQNKGRVTDVVCDQCHKIVPFTQPELSSRPDEATILGHSCPQQILTDKQEALAVDALAAPAAEG